MTRQCLLVLVSLLALLVTSSAFQQPSPIVHDSAGNALTLPDLPGSTVYDALIIHNPAIDVNPYTLTIDLCADCHLSLGCQLGSARLMASSPVGVVLGGHYGEGGEYVLEFDIPSSGRLTMNFTYTAVTTQQDVIVEVSVANPHGAE